MRRRKSNLKYIVAGVAIIIIAVIAIIFLSGKGINISYFYTTYEQPIVELNPLNPTSTSWLNLRINPSTICVGESTTATISSNMPNAPCSIGFNIGSGWNLYKNIQLDSNGRYTEAGTLNTAGSAIFRVVCMDSQQRLAVSNEATLDVNHCPTTINCDTECKIAGYLGAIRLTFVDNPQICVSNGETALQKAGWSGWCCCQRPTTQTKYYCCYAMGISSCYENGCPPAGYEVSGPYNTASECQADCQAQQQMPCNLIIPAVAENCNYGYCDSGSCTFIPATLVMRARCECQTGFCSVGTQECAERCITLCGSPMSQCGGGSCPDGWRSIIGEDSCSATQSCDRCCCQCPI